ncbi:hypothetical protein ig2599ANME_0460 [groundwater metagenome]
MIQITGGFMIPVVDHFTVMLFLYILSRVLSLDISARSFHGCGESGLLFLGSYGYFLTSRALDLILE